jgi:ABC-type multidrug transport system ATPase subunit
MMMRVGGLEQPGASKPPEQTPVANFDSTGTIRIGRDADKNDIVLSDFWVSGQHAEIRKVGREHVIVDLNSSNGMHVNGRRVAKATLTAGDRFSVGRHEFLFDGTSIYQHDDQGPTSIIADDLTVDVKRSVLLDDVSFALRHGTLLGIIGPSGCGKSTLLKALTGIRPASRGKLLYDGKDLYKHYSELRYRIGMVPQDDVMHPQLTVRRALRFAASLRFADDVPRSARRARVNEVLQLLGLTNRARQRVDTLSGGQRKRTSVALELLTSPSLLALDEPTSGLDPALDKEVMRELRLLADGGRTVVVVTHSVLHLDLCDHVLVMCLGGRMGYFGPPDQLLDFFKAEDYADVFDKVTNDADRWAQLYRNSEIYRKYVGEVALELLTHQEETKARLPETLPTPRAVPTPRPESAPTPRPVAAAPAAPAPAAAPGPAAPSRPAPADSSAHVRSAPVPVPAATPAPVNGTGTIYTSASGEAASAYPGGVDPHPGAANEPVTSELTALPAEMTAVTSELPIVGSPASPSDAAVLSPGGVSFGDGAAGVPVPAGGAQIGDYRTGAGAAGNVPGGPSTGAVAASASAAVTTAPAVTVPPQTAAGAPTVAAPAAPTAAAPAPVAAPAPAPAAAPAPARVAAPPAAPKKKAPAKPVSRPIQKIDQLAAIIFRDSKVAPPGPATGVQDASVTSKVLHPVAPIRQFLTLCMRMVAVIVSDRGYAGFLVGLPIALALLGRAVPGNKGLGPDPLGFDLEAERRLAVFIVGAAFMGVAVAIREIVNEQSIYRRERAIGLSPTAYLASKVVIFIIIDTIQVLVFVYLSIWGLPKPKEALVWAPQMLDIIIAIDLVAIASTALGLLASALVRTTEQTTPILVVSVMFQLVLSGGLFPIAGQTGLEILSYVDPARWGLVAAASSTGLPDFPKQAFDPLWIHLQINWWHGVIVMFLQIAALLVGARFALRRFEPGQNK